MSYVPAPETHTQFNNLIESVSEAGVLPKFIESRKAYLGRIVTITTTHILIGKALAILLRSRGWKVMPPEADVKNVAVFLSSASAKPLVKGIHR